MNIVTTIHELRQYLQHHNHPETRVGYAPTMGYLHEGHMALVDRARRDNDIVVVSSFVNPLQFGPNEDLENYPRDPERDANLLSAHGCDVLFTPSVEEMYPEPMLTEVRLPRFSQQLCGKSRPTHFQGVATVVAKLFNIVQPDRAYFGQKDGQQAAVIRKLVRDLSFPVEVVVVPTVREEDGLAKSSRNVYLTETDRAHATVLFRALQAGRQLLEAGERRSGIIAAAMQRLIANEPGVRIDYAEVVALDTLETPEQVAGPVMLACAAYVGKARLIDNLQLFVAGGEVGDLYQNQ